MRSNSPSLTLFSATALILIASPAALAAKTPSKVCSIFPQRVTAVKVAESSVSSETLLRRTPAA